MSRKPSPFTNRHKLNNSTPAAREVSLGLIVEQLLDKSIEQQAVIATLVAKLNADAGVTDTNYVGVATAALTTLASR